MNLDAVTVDPRRQQGRRGDEAHPGAHGVEEENVGPGHPAVRDVSADGDCQAAQTPETAADGERVKQGLGRMLVAAVAGIDHGGPDGTGKKLDRTAVGMPHDEEVGMHRVERCRGVDQGLALLDGAGRGCHVDDIGAESFARQFERRAGPCRAFEEHVDLGAAAQQVTLLLGAPVERHVGVGQIQKKVDVVRRQILDAKQVAMGKTRGRDVARHD